MNNAEQKRWKSEVLAEALLAFAADDALRAALVFKGARILNLRLGEERRQSLDIDSNLTFEFQQAHPAAANQQHILERSFSTALQRHFGRQDPVRFTVVSATVTPKPEASNHPFGWNGFAVRCHVRDGQLPNAKGLPAIEVDVAAPETLGPNAVSDLRLRDGLAIRAYTLERIAGEKMRAFLSSLPAYIQKIGRRTDAVRVRDLYDLVRIQHARPIADHDFWTSTAHEFRLACQSRFVDCAGVKTFLEGMEATRSQFSNDPTLPKDITFEQVLRTLNEVLALFEELAVVSFAFPLPG